MRFRSSKPDFGQPHVFVCFSSLIKIFRQAAGDIFIGFTANLAHRVSKWTPIADAEEEKYGVTPGRVSVVRFFHKAVYEELKDKAPGWGKDTEFGTREAAVSFHRA